MPPVELVHKYSNEVPELRNQAIRILEPCRMYRLADNILRYSWPKTSRGHLYDVMDAPASPLAAGDLSEETER